LKSERERNQPAEEAAGSPQGNGQHGSEAKGAGAPLITPRGRLEGGETEQHESGSGLRRDRPHFDGGSGALVSALSDGDRAAAGTAAT